MTPVQIYLIMGFGLLIMLAGAAVLLYPYYKGGSSGLQSRTIMGSQSKSMGKNIKDSYSKMSKFAEKDSTEVKMANSEMTLEKKLKFAQWTISKRTWWLCAFGISLVIFIIISFKFNILFQILSITSGYLVMNTLTMRAIKKRFKKFDSDYPQFLMQLVGLLKTGMNPVQAIGTAVEGLDLDSLVRVESEIMLERMRLGVSEDKSIGAFGEDINHSEIELFVQALLLSRRVGGTLSDTLDRLAKQVRRRQYFREQANAAVGMQRGSIWFILGIMGALQTYIYFVMPQFVLEAITHPSGWQAWQFGFLVILLAIAWIKQVTNIRV